MSSKLNFCERPNLRHIVFDNCSYAERSEIKFLVSATSLVIFNASAGSLFPQLESCTGKTIAKSCSIVLTETGFLTDRVSGEGIYSTPDKDAVLQSHWLYKTKRGYLFERQNYSSSKTKHWITFEYSNGHLVIDKIYNFSRSAYEPLAPSWGGYECQTKTKSSLKNNELSFFEAAIKTVCGDTVSAYKSGLMTREAQRLDDMGLHISVPIINIDGIEGVVSYVFLGIEEPDIFNMLCLAGCGGAIGPTKSSYFGKVGKRLKINFYFSKAGCGSQGLYRYESSTKSIDSEGCVDSRRMDFIEYGSSRDFVRAYFIGEVDGDGYRGKWNSQNGDNQEYDFFLYPSPLY